MALAIPFAPVAASGSNDTETAATTTRPGPSVPVLEWTDCGAPLECATAVVPRDYDRPNAETFQLAVIRHPAPDQANRIGTLFVNPGGPGGSGIEFLRAAPPGALGLFERFDVVSWDPRGIGASTPALDCTTDAEDKAFTNLTFVRPETADRQQLTREAREFGRRCEQRNPDVLPYLSTANTARDLDLLRQAVGDDRLTYIGISHGTHIGATYSSLFPDKVRAMVADSPIDADAWANRPREMQRERIASFENSLSRFFAGCLAAGDRCDFGGDDPQEAFDALVERLNVAPLPAPSSGSKTPVNGDDLLAYTAEALYSMSDWQELAAGLVQAEAGDGSLLRDLLDAELGRGPDGSLPPSGVLVATTAQDWRYDRRPQSYLDEGYHADAYSPHFFYLSQGYEDLGYPTWPASQHDNYTGPWTHPAAATPALVIGVKHDPATPYVFAERYTDQLGNAQLITYDADGHGALTDLNFCLVVPTLTYITDLVLPEPGLTCEPEYEAFPATSLSRSEPMQEWALPERIVNP
jgi:pimeloyl-ACP methyl ester carboxylesterase